MRRLSDTEAHAADAEAMSIPDHPRICAGEPELVEDKKSFRAIIKDLRGAGEFAFDTEFIGEHTYYPRVCVIQVATRDRIALIDPLGGFDITPVWELLADPDVRTIVHAGMQDLEPVFRLTGKHPAAIFDTQIAAALVGSRYPVSLSELANVYCGAEMGRGLKFSQWDRRPLSPKQKRYAADDVRYLPLLAERLIERLESMDRLSWAEEEFAEFADPGIYRTDPATRKIKAHGVSKMKLRPKTALRELVIWREEVARERDVSPRELIKDELLFEIAEAGITEASGLAAIKGIPRMVRRDLADELTAVVARVFEGPKPKALPRRKRLTETEENAMDAAWRLLGEHCEAIAVAQPLVASRRALSDVVLARCRGKESPDGGVCCGWRAGIVGPVIAAALEEAGVNPSDS